MSNPRSKWKIHEQSSFEKRILGYVAFCEGVTSFAQLTIDVPGFGDDSANEVEPSYWVKANPEILTAKPECRNIILWANMTRQAVDAMQTLFQEGRLIAKHCSQVPYWLLGKVLRMPIAYPRYRGNYKQPRWLPILVCLPSHNANAHGYTEVSSDLLGRRGK